ncbi:putative Dolichyl pyrophosphate Glc1Man9GlcNAc2 alpha-1; 3-glucosyltransferase [Paratrimastix pyriformis]|uniref:Alpha-1,3-glucosyltransferase n=1 Tax=Paratrimastix pyriformis TaxID=342808 RepID=A0ABQ8UE92_9EUKA|nr:putative Dolichyl pyrophosphate Glc1Man9GlcNAc2 alpha-1; 3-glucosyltransferase [Paratrimastix pyriformis]
MTRQPLLLFIAVFCVKVLLFPAYFSTDFEVHRNWLAITQNRPLCEWYFDEGSLWTLDYPPFFAFFEKILSCFASFFDPKMTLLSSYDYVSFKALAYQRLTVALTDGLFFAATILTLDGLGDVSALVGALFVCCSPGFVFVDSIHFQYNGFLDGILVLAFFFARQDRPLLLMATFSALLFFKHIYVYALPAFFGYLLGFYCLNEFRLTWGGCGRLIGRGLVLLSVFALVAGAALGPFLFCSQPVLTQILRRLFPFQRGLTHAYWAPNFWALYNLADKLLSLGRPSGPSAHLAGGLVQTISHVVLPSVHSGTTLFLSFFMALPSVLLLVRGPWIVKRHPPSDQGRVRTWLLLLGAAQSSLSFFMFGWHVHEKAVLTALVPLSLMAVTEASPLILDTFSVLALCGTYSLWPLLHRPMERPILFGVTLTYFAALLWTSKRLRASSVRFLVAPAWARSLVRLVRRVILPLLCWTELARLAMELLVWLEPHQATFGPALRYLTRQAAHFRFTPLLLVSCVCAVGTTVSYVVLSAVCLGTCTSWRKAKRN